MDAAKRQRELASASKVVVVRRIGPSTSLAIGGLVLVADQGSEQANEEEAEAIRAEQARYFANGIKAVTENTK